MSDLFKNISGTAEEARKACYVAYTLNNAQPVTCTIIGDQPLFYMDYEGDFDDAAFDAGDLRILESELETLRTEIENYDRLSRDFIRPPEERLAEFAAAREHLAAPDQKPAESDLVEALKNSRLASAYIECAREHGVEIRYCGQIQDAAYDRRSGLILIHPGLDFAERLLLAARELRRHWQHRQGVLIHPLTFHPDKAVLVNRIQTADLMASVIRMAWELQLSGIREAWERIENSPLADLGRAFAREAFLDFRTLNNGKAAASVFEAWFLSERCRSEDKKLIKQMLADYQGYVFDMQAIQQAVTPALVAALGEMPFGKNYLAPHAQTIIEDPVFTDVRDRSNANFLWFIKFERSFRETEQELQIASSSSPADIRRAGPSREEDLNHAATGKTAAIVSLYRERREVTKRGPARGAGKRKSAEIIYLRRQSEQ